MLGGSNRLIDAHELADALGVPVSRVYDCWRDWQIPVYRIGRSLRWRERDVEAWLSQRKVNA